MRGQNDPLHFLWSCDSIYLLSDHLPWLWITHVISHLCFLCSSNTEIWAPGWCWRWRWLWRRSIGLWFLLEELSIWKQRSSGWLWRGWGGWWLWGGWWWWGGRWRWWRWGGGGKGCGFHGWSETGWDHLGFDRNWWSWKGHSKNIQKDQQQLATCCYEVGFNRNI